MGNKKFVTPNYKLNLWKHQHGSRPPWFELEVPEGDNESINPIARFSKLFWPNFLALALQPSDCIRSPCPSRCAAKAPKVFIQQEQRSHRLSADLVDLVQLCFPQCIQPWLLRIVFLLCQKLTALALAYTKYYCIARNAWPTALCAARRKNSISCINVRRRLQTQSDDQCSCYVSCFPPP